MELVLIVAKCNVNTIWKYPCVGLLRVLIVAKCNVNQIHRLLVFLKLLY